MCLCLCNLYRFINAIWPMQIIWNFAQRVITKTHSHLHFSTETAVTFFCGEIRRNIDNGGAAFIGQKKLLDTICHHIFLNTLQRNDVCGETIVRPLPTCRGGQSSLLGPGCTQASPRVQFWGLCSTRGLQISLKTKDFPIPTSSKGRDAVEKAVIIIDLFVVILVNCTLPRP